MYAILALLLLAATPEPPLAANPPVAERGDVRSGPMLAQTFELAHRGTGTLTITGVEAACGCVKPTVSRRELKPGEKADLAFAINTLTQPAGPNAWRVVVRYRVDEAAFELPVTVTATLIREVSIEPPMVAFSTSSTASQTLTLTDRRAMPLSITSISASSPHLTATLRPASTSATGVQTQAIELAVGPGYPAGEFDESLVLLTNDPACRELRVPVKVTKRTAADVAVSPESPAVRFANGQTDASVVVQLRRPGGGLLRIERIECAHPAVKAKFPGDAGPAATVRVGVNAAKAEGKSGRAELRVILAEPAGRELIVPVAWTMP